MSDAVSRATRAQQEAESRAAAKWSGLTPEQLHTRWAWHRLCADVAKAVQRFAETHARHHERITEELCDARLHRR